MKASADEARARAPSVSREDDAAAIRPQPSASPPRKRLQLEVHARELRMAGRAIRPEMQKKIRDPVFLCEFVATAFIDGRSRELYTVEFLRYSGRSPSIEMLRGADREEAQKALEDLHRVATRDGWEPITKGARWYSYRYEKDGDIVPSPVQLRLRYG